MMDHLLDCTMDHLTIAWWYNYDVWTSQSKSNLSALRWFLKFIISLIAGWLYPYYWLVDKASVWPWSTKIISETVNEIKGPPRP